MLRTDLIHPPLIEALARTGHGSKILIADGNYPFATATGPNTIIVWLNVAPGLLSVDQVLDVLLRTVPVEAGTTMLTPDGEVAPPHSGYENALQHEIELQAEDRFGFYDLARGKELAVLIATGDQRPCANLLLTVGVQSSTAPPA